MLFVLLIGLTVKISKYQHGAAFTLHCHLFMVTCVGDNILSSVKDYVAILKLH